MSSIPDTDTDPVLTELRAARPGVDPARIDAGSPTALALRTRIVADTEEAKGADVGVLPRRPRPRWVAVAAAAAVVALVAVGAGIVGVNGPEPAAASIEEIAAATEQAARGSGRATFTYEEDWPDGEHLSTVGDVRFSGDDVDLVFREEDTMGDEPRLEGRSRVVDGERFVDYLKPLGEGPDWQEYEGLPTDQQLFEVDPHLLQAVLAPEAGFALVGEEELDGRPVTHLRATTPEAVDAPSIAIGVFAEVESLDGLDVWVGEDDVVYQLDMAFTRDAGAQQVVFVDEGEPCPAGSTPEATSIGDGTRGCAVDGDPYWVEASYSVRFHDLGTPVTIERPEHVGPGIIP